ncbi:MAG: hypothetical protein J7K75_00865 [Desulfuromonas sp.]|nr:hypothetical protein [Desulfuromonas sp.]
MTTIRIMSYNLKGCRDSGAVWRVIDQAGADFVALQNVAELPSSKSLSALAAFTGQKIVSRGETRALALLSGLPVKFIQTYDLGFGAGCMKAKLHIGDKRCLLYNLSLHGGLFKRLIQIRRLLGPDLLDQPGPPFPTLVLGDFLDMMGMASSLRVHKKMQRIAPLFAGTYPAFFPIFARDRVYAMQGVKVQSIRIDRSADARRATAHLPLIMDISLVDNLVGVTSSDVKRHAKMEIAPG